MSGSISFSSSCPSGGQFYACNGSSGFLECCTTEPCHRSDRCPDDSQRPPNLNGLLSDRGSCTAGFNWWACDNASSLFVGCCESDENVCISECLNFDQDITPNRTGAAASSISDTMLPSAPSFVPIDTANTPEGANSITYTSQDFTASNSVATDSAPIAIATSQTAPQTTRPASSSNTAAIAGGVAGAIVGLALLLALLVIFCRRRISRQQQHLDELKPQTWGLGQARAIQPDDAELEEVKHRQSPPSSPSPLPPPPPSPLLQSSPLLPPPAYSAYRLNGHLLNRSLEPSKSSASSQYSSHDPPSPESPPSPPPLQSRLSQHSVDRYSEEQSVSPISSHYQHQPFRENAGPESSMYSEVSSSELLQIHGVRP